MNSETTVVILTFNEEIHVKRCIESVSPLTNEIVVVDSYSTDDTCDLAVSCGAKVLQNTFINQADQFQWAMDNCGIETKWVLRVDADETIDSTMVHNIKDFIANDGFGHNAGILHRKHIFLGKWVKHGGRYPLPMLRLFRRGTAHVEQRWMDEHIVLDEGTAKVIDGGFEDNNINSVSWFIDKHNKYATREMVDIMLKRLQPASSSEITENTGVAIRFKRFLKESVYMKLPYFVRPFLYFNFRYFIQLGFLDGARGFAYHFMQAFWYRALVDLKCIEVERLWENCDNDTSKIAILEQYSGYRLS